MAIRWCAKGVCRSTALRWWRYWCVFWKASEQPCGKRLAAMLELWLPYDEREHGRPTPAMREKVLGISPAQVDRLLAPHKAGTRRGRCGTKPGGLLKHQIPIRTDNWDITMPGDLEADTVAHCGTSLEGEFILERDLYRHPQRLDGQPCRLEQGRRRGGGSHERRGGRTALCDPGLRLRARKQSRLHPVAALPQKRQRSRRAEELDPCAPVAGYDRLQDPALRQEINALYRDIWEPFHNYFCPSAKLLIKDRHGAKIKRRHDRPMTPCDRLLASSEVSAATRKNLRQTRAVLNPFDLQRRLDAALRPILQRD